MRRWIDPLALLLALLVAVGGLALAEGPELELDLPPEDLIVEAADAPDALDVPIALEAPEAFEAPVDGGTAELFDANDGATLSLNAEKLKLGVGESFRLVPAVTGDGDATFRFRSSKPEVATVNGKGKVVARAVGRANVEVTTADGLSAVCAVRVLPAPDAIQLNQSAVTLGYDAQRDIGMTFRLKASLPSGTCGRVVYSSYNTGVVGVDESGVLTPRGVGTAKVRARTYNGLKAIATVTVLPAPEAIALSEEELLLMPGEVHTLAAILPEGTTGTVTFRSDDATVAKVNAKTGRIRAVALGETTVTAVAFNGVEASCQVKVLMKPASISLASSQLTVGLGEARSLEAMPLAADGSPAGGGLTFASSKPSVASVSADGVVTGVKKGSATITVTAIGGITATCAVKVVGAPGSVQVSAEDPKLAYDPDTGEGDSTVLKVTLPSGSASAIAYTGYDPDVLEISADGVATAVGTGTTRVTVSTFNGRTAWCVIRVLSTREDCMVNVAHRGGAAYWPENTLEAFRNTESTGATAVELDARTTKDGVQVVHHDEYFTSGGKKRYINKLTLSELKRLKPSLCTLDEALDVISATGLELDLELKKTADPEACVRIVRSHNMRDRTVYIAFEQSLLKKVRSMEPSARLGYIITSTPSGLDSVISNLGLCYIAQKYDSLNRTNLLKWQNRGLLVGVWTVDGASSIRKWMDMGVDYLTSNYPRRVTEALGR